jgi:uncharacterized protein with GYD domain
MAEVLSSNLNEPILLLFDSHSNRLLSHCTSIQSLTRGSSAGMKPVPCSCSTSVGPELRINITGTIKPLVVRKVPTYMILMKLTEKGSQEIKASPERIEKAIADFEGMGGKLIAFFALMGKYDYIAVGDAPSDEIAMTFVVGLNSHGFVRTTSFRAFTVEEFTGMVNELP